MGTKQVNLEGVDITIMRKGSQVTMEQRAFLVKPITVTEIEKALHCIGDSKAPSVDGFGAKFFKASWNIVKEDVIKVVMEFFEKGVIDKNFNRTLVMLIPKHEHAKTIKEYRPISCCTTVYKFILKIMSTRLSNILPRIISRNQVAFLLGQNIHDHVLLAFELLKGYGSKGGEPRCMIQMDI